jgi:superfamily II DNA/RNA helicase
MLVPVSVASGDICVCVYRLRRLLQEIGSEKENKTIIFVETKRKVDEITRNIRRDGFVLW